MKMLYAIVALFCILLASAVAQDNKPKKEAKYVCFAGPNEICPSDLWVADYEKLLALRKKYSAPQDIQDMMNGMGNRLAQQIPQGYGWDEKKQRFVKTEAPPVAAAPPPADGKK